MRNDVIDLDNITDESDLSNELLDAAEELRAMGMHSLAAAVDQARARLEAPPASGTFTTITGGVAVVPRVSVGI